MSRAANPPTPTVDDEVQPPKLELSASQLAGGALASVTSALAASRFGVNGTVLGAAFGSLVSGVAAAVYATSLRTAHYKMRTTRSVVLRAPVPLDGERTVAVDPADPTAMPPELSGRAVPLPGVTMSVPAGTPPGQAPIRPRRAQRRRPVWKPVALVAGTAFVTSMLAIGVLETAIGHPISNAKGSGTSVGVLVGGGSDPTTAPATTTSGTSTSGSDSASSSPTDSSPSPTDTSPTDSTASSPTATGGSPTGSDAASPTPSVTASAAAGQQPAPAQPTPSP